MHDNYYVPILPSQDNQFSVLPPKKEGFKFITNNNHHEKNSPRTYIDRSSLGSGATCNFGAKPVLYFAVQGARD
jgi:hypothetical protein